MRNTLFHIILLCITVTVLLAELSNNTLITFIAKPLIMLWVIVYYLLNTQKGNYSKIVISAFIAAWAGDILLMFQDKGGLFFILGLGCFLVCQLLFAFVFIKPALANDIKHSLLIQKPLLLVGLIFYTGTLYTAMYPGLDETMLIPVFVYAFAITLMVGAALNRKGYVPDHSFYQVLTGALLFVLSDSLLGLNKFTFEIPFGGFWIMLTYITAQYFIMKGIIIETYKKQLV